MTMRVGVMSEPARSEDALVDATQKTHLTLGWVGDGLVQTGPRAGSNCSSHRLPGSAQPRPSLANSRALSLALRPEPPALCIHLLLNSPPHQQPSPTLRAARHSSTLLLPNHWGLCDPAGPLSACRTAARVFGRCVWVWRCVDSNRFHLC
eukprot:1979355-Rhodomonas_salina.1